MLSSPFVSLHRRSLVAAAIAFVASVLAADLRAQELVPLISPTAPDAGWRFNNGQEFPAR